PCITCRVSSCLFFSNVPTTTEIYTLSLHDALPISCELCGRNRRNGALPDEDPPAAAEADRRLRAARRVRRFRIRRCRQGVSRARDRKSTRLNSSHRTISYAVFCLKKKKKHKSTKRI